MRRKSRTAASGLSLAQVRAIGRVTINFNWMEHCLDVLIRAIIKPHDSRFVLVEPVLKPMRFTQKLRILRELVIALSDQYVPSAELDRAYQRFCSAMKTLISKAGKLNELRNSIVHWRPFLTQDANTKPKPTATTANEIERVALEMDKVGTEFFARAIYLYKGDGSLTFGTHLRKN